MCGIVTSLQCLEGGMVLYKLVPTYLIDIVVNSLKVGNVYLDGCETWSLTLREERRLRVFENRVLRRVFGPKRDEVTGEWRKLS